MRLAALALLLLAFALSPPANSQSAPKLKLSAELGAQARIFFDPALDPAQRGTGVSLSLEPELDYAIAHGNVRLKPFARIDETDPERSHVDVREFILRQRYGDFDLVAGIGRVFWGATESVHLVDIINQTDLVEDPDGEDKLGQPLVNLAWASPWGTFSGYVIPGFRERKLPGEKGRLRGPIPYDLDTAQYESSARRGHVDAAARWSLSRGALDLGVSHFRGTSREPRFALEVRDQRLLLQPVYDQIDQTGIDINVVSGGWLLKGEAIRNSSRAEDFVATAFGFEYSFASIFGGAWDIGLLSEFLWDSRGADSPSPFQKDLFLGTRLAANDVAGSELLAGAIIDLDRGGAFASIEASRRIGPSGKLSLELRLFDQLKADDALYPLRRDDYIQLEYSHYF